MNALPTISVEQSANREDWLKAREEGHAIGASAAVATMTRTNEHGEVTRASRFSGPWDLWNKRTNGVETPQTPAMLRGSVLEPLVLEWWRETDGGDVQWYDNAVVRRSDVPWAIYSPDGRRITHGPAVPVEVKTARGFYGWPDDGRISLDMPGVRPDYVLQPTWQAVVEGSDTAELVVCLLTHKGDDIITKVIVDADERGDIEGCLHALRVMLREFGELRHYVIDTPQNVRDALLEQVGKWREPHLVNGEEPPPDHSSQWAHAMTEADRGVADKDEELPDGDEDAEAKVARWQALNTKRLALQKEADAAKKAAMEAVVNEHGLNFGGRKVVWKKKSGQRGLSVGNVEKNHPELFALLERAGAITKTRDSRSLDARGDWRQE